MHAYTDLVRTVESTNDTDYCNELLQQGWVLLSSGVDPIKGTPTYVLGLVPQKFRPPWWGTDG